MTGEGNGILINKLNIIFFLSMTKKLAHSYICLDWEMEKGRKKLFNTSYSKTKTSSMHSVSPVNHI